MVFRAILFLFLSASAFAADKPLDAMVKAFYEVLPTEKAKDLEATIRAPLTNRAKFGDVASVAEKAKHCPTKGEIHDYATRLAGYYRRQGEAITAAEATGAVVVSDRLFHLMIEDFSGILAQAVGEVLRPGGKLSIGTGAVLKRYAIALERFADKRIELYTERDEDSGGKRFDPEADDFLVDNLHFVMSAIGAPISVADRNAFTNRDARGVRCFREALHVMQREIDLGLGLPVKITVPRVPAWINQ